MTDGTHWDVEKQAKGGTMFPRLGAAAILLLVALPGMASGQIEEGDPSTYALINGRIVVSPDHVIEGGSVLLQGGRIMGVGQQVNVPADAFRMDASGLTVYAGLVDAANSMLLPRIPPAKHGDRDPTDVQPGRRAVRWFRSDEALLMELRAAGITAVGLAWEGGIVPGQTGVVNLTSPPTIMNAETSLQVAFGTREDRYPIALMGTLAWLRQAFLDAARYREFATAYRNGLVIWDLTLDELNIAPIAAAAGGEIPVWFTASDENDILRALELAEEATLEAAIVGAQEGYRTVSRVAARGWPVLLSLALPDPANATGWAYDFVENMRLRGPDGARTHADSLVSDRLRRNASVLVDAGIPVALTSFGLESADEMSSRLGDALAQGLSASEALRALTVTPAKILGVEQLLGSVEVGKLANILVVEGSLFDDGRIRHVFVHGIRYDCAPTESSAAKPACRRAH